MKRWGLRVIGVALSCALAVLAVARGNVIGAVFFGVATLSLVWFALRPVPDNQRQRHPFRGMVGVASVFTVGAVAMVAAAIHGPDETSRGLGLVAASIGVPTALVFWAFVYRGWRDGWRWSSAVTGEEMAAAHARGERLPPPSEA